MGWFCTPGLGSADSQVLGGHDHTEYAAKHNGCALLKAGSWSLSDPVVGQNMFKPPCWNLNDPHDDVIIIYDYDLFYVLSIISYN